MTPSPSSRRSPPAGPAILALLLIAEAVVFSVIGTNFLSLTNAFEVGRLSVEIGLLALALTPVIVTGGIDLSVGSLLGLSAVLLGEMWRYGVTVPLPGFNAALRTGPLPIGAAALLTLLAAAAAGGLNALLITRFRIPALIVTLGSYSLFRGLAEGMTGGVDNFTGFPREFLYLGQGPQLLIFAAAAVGFWALLHRTTFGRALSAVGFSAEGARHAGIPVERRVALTYVLSGLSAGLAAIIYVAHWGQAKADAGTGYELSAITAVVLGGTSIFGGRGSVPGTLLGLFAVAVLQNGLRLADLPPELAGCLTGVLLLAAIGLSASRKAKIAAPHPSTTSSQEPVVKNSQVAVICAVILVAAAVVAGSNYLLWRSVQPRPVTVAMMPKSKGNAYFIACRKGAEAAAKELGVQLIWDGPTDPDPAKQNEIVEAWITRGVDVIAVAVENREGIAPVLQKARERGIKVLTWDADTVPDARDFFVNQATPEGIARTLMDNAARVMGGKGKYAIITGSPTAANLNEWRKDIKAYQAEKYPDIQLAAEEACDDLQAKASDEASAILKREPDVKLILAICSPAVPGAAEAVKQSGRQDVKVIGLGLPNDNKGYVHAGITDCIVLWKTADLGYLTVYAANALQKGKLEPGDKEIRAGRLGVIKIEGDSILLGKPFTFNKDNIDQFDF